jgi:hypothetical protein
LDYYPQVCQIREIAIGKQEDRDRVEALRAFEFCCDFALRHWHPDVGKYSNAPKIPPRTAYALRHIGGLMALDRRTSQSEPFLRKDFISAYILAPVADLMAPELEAFDVKKLTSAKSLDRAIPKEFPAPRQQQPEVPIPVAFSAEQERALIQQKIAEHNGKAVTA